MAKRINPRRHPVTAADLKRAKDSATNEALKLALYIVLFVLIDKHNAPKEDIKQFICEINYLSDSINRGDINWKDLRSVLEGEYDVQLELK